MTPETLAALLERYDEVVKRKARFAELVDSSAGPDQCWLWLGSTYPKTPRRLPYGRFYISKSKIVRSHRAAWMIANGPIPDGMLVCHACDNARCCNPNHLWLGSIQDNNKDRIAKGRSYRATIRHPGNWSRGEAHGSAKLSSEQVELIRDDRRSSRVIAREYGVSFSTICRIKKGALWAPATALQQEADRS